MFFMMQDNIILALSDMGDTLTTLKQEAFIFLIALALWLLFKCKKVFIWIYQKVCPPEITRILTEPEPVVERQIRKSTIVSQLVMPLSPRNSIVNSRKGSVDSTYVVESDTEEIQRAREIEMQRNQINI